MREIKKRERAWFLGQNGRERERETIGWRRGRGEKMSQTLSKMQI